MNYNNKEEKIALYLRCNRKWLDEAQQYDDIAVQLSIVICNCKIEAAPNKQIEPDPQTVRVINRSLSLTVAATHCLRAG